MTVAELEKASSPEVLLTVPLHRVLMDETMQSRVKMQPGRVREYETAYRNGGKLPPLRVVIEEHRNLEDEPTLVLIDGWHRMQALLNSGAKEVEVLVVRVPSNCSPHLLRWMGGSENLKNGVPLDAKDKRSLFRDYVRAGMHRKPMGVKSSRDIAKDIPSCSHQSILRWMQKDFPAIYARMGRDDRDDGDTGREHSGPPPAIDMPKLDGRKTRMIFEDLIQQSQAADGRQRQKLLEQAREFVKRLESGESFLAQTVQRYEDAW